MVHTETIRTIVGVIGNVISFGLFASPIPTFVKILKEKSVGEFKPDPYLATTLNCMMWVFYGLPFVHPDSILVVTINSIGLVMEAAYLTIFFTYAPWNKRKKVIFVLLIEIIFMALVIFITVQFFHTHSRRSMFVGILCCIFGIIMYGSPLTIMGRVIRTRSVKYMPFLLSLANFANGLVWSIYALLHFDPYVLVPNGLGFLLAVAQIVLYVTYCRATPREDGNRTEVELSQTA
ncbi:SWEET sugar transporter [Dillenia turbinata]|uniref:Bidirectional sugar transporter SWEET n=1 Tax=Dillenia turbinata TaxID=194707 RepID=A0AAN8UX13_9MAGN